tara:strand:+ start:344 stop:781 length:438 start_codon:yes stop_codon:yes gene_type:complete
MKPTQEQILSALNKLVRENKTELKAEKIELGAIDDLKKELSDSDKILKGMSKLAKEKDGVVNNIKSLVKQNDKLASKGRSIESQGSENLRNLGLIREKIEKQAKELGLNANDIPQFKESFKMIEKIKSADFGLLSGKVEITFVTS